MIYNFGELRKVSGLLIIIRLYFNKLTKAQRLYFFLRWCVRYFFFKSILDFGNTVITKNITNIVIYQYLNRPDIENSFLIGDFPPNSVKIRIRRQISLKFKKIVCFIRIFFMKNFSLKKALFRIVLLELDEISETIKNNNQILNKKVFFYNEKQLWEGLMCIALQKNEIVTYSFTHGFYRDTGRICSLINTNPFNYLYQISKKQICWGKIQKQIMSKYDTSNTDYIILGKRDLMVRPASASISKVRALNVLILDSTQLAALNKSSAKSLSQIEKHILVKKHPDDKNDYQFSSVDNLNEVLDDVVTFWGTNSSAILQIARAGYRVGVFKKSDFLQYIDSKYYKRVGDFYIIDQDYDWAPFINLTGDEYLEAFQRKCL